MDIDINKVLETVKNKNLLSRFSFFLVGVFITALNYNILVIPNNYNIGGSSGLAIIFKALLGIKPATFILILSLALLFVSFFTVGKKQTFRNLIGALLYPLLITMTEPLAAFLTPYFQFNNTLLTIIICGFLLGIGEGLTYKAGFTLGGGDIIMQLISKYQKIPEGKAQLILNIIIISFGTFLFGIENAIYSVLIIIIATTLVDKILIGISDSKMFFIYSKKINQVKKFVIQELQTGITVFNTEGGYNSEDQQMLMVVVSTKDYYLFKETILTIDPDAFFVVSDCYEVSGGVKQKNLPFI